MKTKPKRHQSAMKKIITHSRQNPLPVVGSVFIVAAIGTVLLLGSHAASPFSSSEVENGSLAGTGASKIVDSAASGGNYVQFGMPPAGTTPAGKLVLNGRQIQVNGTTVRMRGSAVWGINDNVTSNGNTGGSGYADRVKIAQTIKAWGGNSIRLRVLGCDYNSSAFMSQTQYIQEVADWQAAAQANGLYLGIVAWDPTEYDCSSTGGSAWAGTYSQAFSMFTAIINKLGANNPWVFYEPYNEPHAISDSSWQQAMQDTIHLFRTNGYTGILVLDPNSYSHEYWPGGFSALQSYDNGQPGMNGKNQLVFAKHDYSNEFSGSSWSDGSWRGNSWGSNAQTWDPTAYPVWETEFGNYNIGNENLGWSSAAASAFAGYLNNGTLVGATAFVWHWVDPNTITNGDNVTPTQWGGYVKNNFLSSVN